MKLELSPASSPRFGRTHLPRQDGSVSSTRHRPRTPSSRTPAIKRCLERRAIGRPLGHRGNRHRSPTRMLRQRPSGEIPFDETRHSPRHRCGSPLPTRSRRRPTRGVRRRPSASVGFRWRPSASVGVRQRPSASVGVRRRGTALQRISNVLVACEVEDTGSQHLIHLIE